MNRILIAVATAVFAVGAMLAQPAQAGFKGGRLAIGLAVGAIMLSQQHRYEHQHWKKKRYYARHKAPKKVYAAKKSKPATKVVAKAEPEPAPLPEPKVVENENSSISTAALEPIEDTASIDSAEPTPEADKVVAEVPETASATGQERAKKLDCKKFFPTVGMTLSVPCE